MSLDEEEDDEDCDDEVELVSVDAVLFEAAVPGIVAALTAASRPTPARAAAAAPKVSRFRRRRASSRAVERSLSMGSRLAVHDELRLWGCWELARKSYRRMVPPEGIEPPLVA